MFSGMSWVQPKGDIVEWSVAAVNSLGHLHEA